MAQVGLRESGARQIHRVNGLGPVFAFILWRNAAARNRGCTPISGTADRIVAQPSGTGRFRTVPVRVNPSEI
jgi:hypothetical protein